MPSPFLPSQHVGILFRFERPDLLPLPRQRSTERAMYEGQQDSLTGGERRVGDRAGGNARRRHMVNFEAAHGVSAVLTSLARPLYRGTRVRPHCRSQPRKAGCKSRTRQSRTRFAVAAVAGGREKIELALISIGFACDGGSSQLYRRSSAPSQVLCREYQRVSYSSDHLNSDPSGVVKLSSVNVAT